jgi:hypothetical protein
MQRFHGKRTANAFFAIILGCKYQFNAEPIGGRETPGKTVRFTQSVAVQQKS